MQHQPLTYKHLLDSQARAVSCGDANAQTAANRATALRLFLRSNRILETDIVGSEMRSRYTEASKRLVEHLRGEGRTDRSISNTRAALNPWVKAVLEADHANARAQGLETPFQVSLKSAIGELTIKWVAREAGVAAHTLYGWLDGKQPRASNAKYIRRIEMFFGIPKDSLVRAAGIDHGIRSASSGRATLPIPYREALSSNTANHYYLKPGPESPLRNQWNELLRYKTAPVPSLERGNGGRWTFSALDVVRPTERNWWTFFNGVEVPSARAGWNKVASYLGWLSMPTACGGAGLSADECHTLAWLAVPDHIESYLNWRKANSGGKYSNSVLEFLATVQWLVRPGNGYLFQLKSFSQTLPSQYRDGDWHALCERQHTYTRKLKQALSPEVEPSRDPFEPIKHILELEQPMEAVVDMLQRMRNDRPIGNEVDEATWARDMVLIKLLATAPLRRRNLATLTWTPDNRGHVYQRSDGSWWVRVPRPEKKNRAGTVTANVYDVPLHEKLWSDLERYLFRHRSILLRWPSNLLLLARTRDPERTERIKGGPYKRPASTEHRPLMNISDHVFDLTRKYLWKCKGVGTHAFRHLVATSILKAPAGDMKTAALVLHDAQSTVEKHYAHLASGDGARRMSELLAKTLQRM